MIAKASTPETPRRLNYDLCKVIAEAFGTKLPIFHKNIPHFVDSHLSPFSCPRRLRA
ncbi:hypothetical protein AO1008_10029 [Aspergillus oryzae 100-8]|uniref:Uncharacterized protein n=1 Tax=Aspergillus oryzae (strain 3.042) TaxID=1160506 RepID=I7ZM00_ASPO3|nr:hypothetical protein Ao3042_00945 [Aspergillus oryzae 3.042]KDE83482.1 hypothetical protein AO1008_10029 [Aspergillus oryzae 100-8]|eukprot:EIT72837.1 hypothetical protein Ao3042_00945 [Aspergillus oryzae 3.042]